MKLYKAYAKVNVFLKITGKRDNYHEIVSRFVKVDSLYDELSFVTKEDETDELKIIGEFSCSTKQNTIYKAYMALLDALDNTRTNSLKNLMRKYAVHVNKNIPAFAGLGGGSSDAATFLKMCNEVLHLGLSKNELSLVGLKVGADVAFFIYGYDSANVSGIGEIVEEFKEEHLDFEVFTPKLEISTPKVYAAYRENFYNPIDGFEANKLKKTSSLDILKTMKPDEANDLFKPALQEYKELKNYYKHGYYFSGSGSSFFRVKNKENE
ncbi:MAG: 4-(cytidine 5'-diphospho)-2-C-methyl-D-erythritol kinase [Sulfurimonas sp. RIFOXYD12_FULL_33_39]|uniref:4-(cytidine 5'-diphospho)-2-C-methyl-D-erythritol kinase n=1 Tax=unclassified Sulfurimonas TaxID=2623549 RepID=UPI0008D01CC6|nr:MULTISPECIES: 4-(cytidine 5'-diphospho)-2-C-methyl-D-erythritol kinase [unclassified Sulfurimonas]OHE01147.1 MAG: 4-(cytidine 5'-diphospho)-2-C-methyl-D-erythritol kinase [Sulfurimonas sp. RIFCSPLOWO2_12_FULL_34_6]OHE09592.1 MAG: 4-(cytidine 5'-diphospho)-2-C-methyl-D-erythritol kinase [Sulfurimonas sp. RIFOXYD12_FULL_33_39]OHE13902.1 MAG: 4-(cytidine 5'-diphospho)-2-C-methyl-D-erythritol kinase [Sulfurimonas sp. RIFOXYD2_FULL_34_21]DAB28551.1 MAG TPA: 4-(cytidine 5'-diphospho)-2-C-methyl-D-